jgi:hypothetical protein
VGSSACASVIHASPFPLNHRSVTCLLPSGFVRSAITFIQNQGSVRVSTATVSYRECPAGMFVSCVCA